MNRATAPELEFDPAAEASRIEGMLRHRLEALHRDGAVVPLSGGLDSAVVAVLTLRALGTDRVTLLNMPDRDSAPIHQEHAREFAASMGATLIRRPITRVLRASDTYRLLPLRYLPTRRMRRRLVKFLSARILGRDESAVLAERLKPPRTRLVARANAYAIAKHRIRMTITYQYAEVHHSMVVGAANRTEWLTGTFSKWGVDHCADVMPILHLFRSQVDVLAHHLELPEYLRAKPADPDVLPGVDDKGALLGDFGIVDAVLLALESGATEPTLKATYPADLVDRLLELYALSAHMREAPYTMVSE